MSEVVTENLKSKRDDQIKALSARLDAAENALRAMIHAMKELEEATGDPLMPEGEYFGYKF